MFDMFGNRIMNTPKGQLSPVKMLLVDGFHKVDFVDEGDEILIPRFFSRSPDSFLFLIDSLGGKLELQNPTPLNVIDFETSFFEVNLKNLNAGSE